MDTSLVDYMQSRPLIGFQIDGAHLNNVLQAILKQLGQLQGAVGDLAERQNALQRAIGDLGGPERLQNFKERLDELERAMDAAARGLADTRQRAEAAADDADAAGRLADKANRAAAPLQDGLAQLAKEVAALGQQQQQDARDIGRALGDLEAARADHERRVAEGLRDVQAQADRLARESGVERLRQMLQELSDRTDENFVSVAETAKNVDRELGRHAAELQQLQRDLAAQGEQHRGNLNALAADTDEKYQILLNAFREYEKSSNELEEHLALAGQALARRRRAN